MRVYGLLPITLFWNGGHLYSAALYRPMDAQSAYASLPHSAGFGRRRRTGGGAKKAPLM